MSCISKAILVDNLKKVVTFLNTVSVEFSPEDWRFIFSNHEPSSIIDHNSCYQFVKLDSNFTSGLGVKKFQMFLDSRPNLNSAKDVLKHAILLYLFLSITEEEYTASSFESFVAFKGRNYVV